ncbi:hypothetical protein [Chromohalobacter sp. 296-RDG]|uniref:hypothetical protein n=1 Tax=Chromohalobacter sp. 296-RDG TaxID=2994062 RepID=UPI002468FF0A|nr:hypothetical protein [Chromohalobacter sp. 296-RDG]
MSTQYKDQFYEQRDRKTRKSAGEILGTIWPHIDIKNVLDIGCGVGTWLDVANKMGALNATGLEGPWVKNQETYVDKNKITLIDFENLELDLSEQEIDLTIWLEVAEHLTQEASDDIISKLRHSSQTVLFSAAIPGQGGRGHINEQWQSHWIDCFRRNGYIPYDYLRKIIWTNEDIPFWYRQNIFLFSRTEIESLNDCKITGEHRLANLVHPALFERECERIDTKKFIRRTSRALKNMIT